MLALLVILEQFKLMAALIPEVMVLGVVMDQFKPIVLLHKYERT